MKVIDVEDAKKLFVYLQESVRGIECDGTVNLRVLVANLSRVAVDSFAPAPIHISYHWLDYSGKVVVHDGLRSALAPPLLPGDTAEYSMTVQAPPQAGLFTLCITLVQEGMLWFDQESVGRKNDIDIEIFAQSPKPLDSAKMNKRLIQQRWEIYDTLEPDRFSAYSFPCLICGGKIETQNAEPLTAECAFLGGKLVRYRCPHCGGIVGPLKVLRLPPKGLAEDYQEHYTIFAESDATEYEIRTFYQLHPSKKGRYLNYGCGAWSKAIATLRADGYDVYGYEPYSNTTENQYILTDEDILKDFRFDGIFSNNLLEHLMDPAATLFFMKTLLADNMGQMAHSTPCYEYLYEYTRFHVVFYTNESIHALCDRVGLTAYDKEDSMINQERYISYRFKIDM